MSDRALIDVKLQQLQEMLATMDEGSLTSFQERLDMSWIYHDCALEGVVLTYHELKSAIDRDVVSDVSLIPTYDEIRAHKNALDWIREQAAKGKKHPITLDLLLELREVLQPEPTVVSAVALVSPMDLGDGGLPLETPKPKPLPVETSPYRKDTPVHRLYFHDIPAADKIQSEMVKLADWLQEPEAKKLPAIRLAARLHFRLMQIYPFSKNSGKHARLAMNMVLLRAGYPPAIIHSTERQRYYEALRGPVAALQGIMLESLENSIESAIKMFTESKSGRRAMT